MTTTTITGDDAQTLSDLAARLSGLYDWTGNTPVYRNPDLVAQIGTEAAGLLNLTSDAALAVLLDPATATTSDGTGVTFTYQSATTE